VSDLAIIPDEDHDRAQYVGGSDIASVLGISPWRTPFQCWQRKVTQRLAPPDDEQRNRTAKKRGHRWESVVAEMLVEHLEAEGHKVEIVASNRRYKDAELPFLASEIDFEIRLDDEDEITNVELKTVHPFAAKAWGDAGTDEIPVYYTAQAMHGLGITHRRRCIVAPLFGADEIKAFFVERDDETIAAMRNRASIFWHDHVLTGVPPEPITLDDLAALYPGQKADVTLLADDHLKAAWLRLRALKNEIKAREAEFDAVAFEVQRAMQDATILALPGDDPKNVVTWKPRESSFVDLDGLRAEAPKLIRSHTRKRTARAFIVQEGK
jgi:putative phage-type endonuclease